MNYAGNFPIFWRSFRKAYNALFSSVEAGLVIVEKVSLCGGDRGKYSVVAVIDFIEVVS